MGPLLRQDALESILVRNIGIYGLRLDSEKDQCNHYFPINIA